VLKQKLLGAAFAACDLIFEVDQEGLITFALGSTQGLAASEDGSLEGQCWRNLFSVDDQYLLAALLRGLQSGERKGPLAVTLAPETHDAVGRPAMLSVFRLPSRDGDPMSCALTFHSMSGWSDGASGGLLDREAFTETTRRLMHEAEAAGLSLRVDLVELDGLESADAGEGNDVLRRRLAATLRANSYNGEGASEVAPDRFAVLRPVAASAEDLGAQLGEISGGAVKSLVAGLSFSGGSINENIRALRYALGQYIDEGAKVASLNFSAVLRKTAQEAVKLKSALASRSWSLVYQPVVTLQDESLHHFEALARFEPGVSPAPSICLAEELGLIADLDLAVARKVAEVLSKQKPSIEVAVNISAASLMQPSFQRALAAVTEHDTRLRPRLLLELTETQKLTDLGAADKAIQSLRRLGHSVCLDDFGAGAASLDYLRQLQVDFIKFDGRYIRSLTADSRDEVIIKHMVSLCRELRIETIAEMIETPATARVCLGIGVGLGQGWSFAKPSAELIYPLPSADLPVRRKGAVTSWG
jgi:EAL domain-containing protein (putative c-di-GMP-specific phosphodiesterase class I)